jgi:hypothetical protein
MAVDDQIDDILADGPNTASNIARHTGSSRQYVWDRLNARDDIERVDDGLYRLADAATGRADAERLREVRGALGRLKIEVNKGTETQDELFERVQTIEAAVDALLDDLDDE